ncbi:Retroelement pol polyprotein-like [Rhynchospora pubera]|uniref:Retroelement pol polyprotein-like n=1 Tax=Rhynchospora pubera TaxID=906938 RepID=A0AAV8FBE4_9POAL|nr:Retroelement pol polyprotein-like [Rhynchospora pubera]
MTRRSSQQNLSTTPHLFISPSDSPGMMISSCILKGENYDLWVKAMRNALRAKNKLGFVDGTITQPKDNTVEAAVWGSCNSMLVSWLFNCIDPSLQPSVAYFETVKELWDDLKGRFSVGDVPRIHQLKADIAGAKQQGQPVLEYYTRLKTMWDELSSYVGIPTCMCGVCTCNLTAKFAQEKEEERIHQFFMGLDEVFGSIRTNILSMTPLPNLNRVYSMVIQEERHKTVIRGRAESTDAVGFAVHVAKAEAFSNKTGDKPTCSHCGKLGHEMSQCFEIIGYLDGWGRGRRGGRGGRGPGRGRGRGRAQAHAVQGGNNAVQDAGMSSSQHVIPGLSDAQVQQIKAILAGSSSTNASASSEKLHGEFPDVCWILDSGASHHMTGDFGCLKEVYKVTPSVVELPNGAHAIAEHEGSVCLPGGIVLKRVLFVPSLNCNLISLGKLIAQNDCFVTFTNELCVVQDCNLRTLIGVGEHKNGVYYYHPKASSRVCHARRKEDHELWHLRMGHPSYQLTSLISGAKGDSSDIKNVCETCLKAKQTRDVFPISLNKANESFELIHCDIWGPYRIASSCGAHYFLTIVDDFSRAVWVYLMKDKSETADLLQGFVRMVYTQFQKSVKSIRSDNGTEFTSRLMKQFCTEKGIIYQTSCVGTPQQNGRVERKHRHILNVARALRFQSDVPLKFWGECILTATYLINRTPTPLLQNKTPYEMLFGKPPAYTPIRCFGCLCYVKIPTLDKFGSRARKCVFIGYPFGKKGWRVLDLETNKFVVSRDVVFVETVFPFKQKFGHDAEVNASEDRRVQGDVNVVPGLFSVDCEYESNSIEVDSDARGSNDGIAEGVDDSNEHVGTLQNAVHDDARAIDVPIATQEPNRAPSTEHVGTLQNAVHDDARAIDVPIATQEPNRAPSTRVRQPPAKLHDYICYTAHVDPFYAHPTSIGSSGTPYSIAHYVNCNMFSLKHRKFLSAVTKEKEPEHFGEAVKSKHWRDTMQAEIEALERNDTWRVEDLPPGKTSIGCKWVYRIKYNSDGTIERYKARLVVLGNRQVEGIDYNETFSPVVKMTTVRVVLAVAVARGWEMHQMDVHNAFLHGDLHEEVYMRMPPGFGSSHPAKVCRLKKSLYGLRQAPRMWFSKLTAALEGYGFAQSRADYSLFVYNKGDVFLTVLVYVDDLVIAGNNTDAINHFKQYLCATFHMKDLGQLKYFLGIEIARGPVGLFLSQRKYSLDIIAECGLLGAKPAMTPLEHNHNLAKATGDEMKDPEKYRRLVGRLIYLTITRPELCYAVHTLAQFMHAPLQIHYAAAVRVVRYLKKNPGQEIVLRADNDLQLYGYCDSDWASCPITRRSLTGYFVLLGDSPISWKTKKQHTVSRSSAEAGYRSMASLTCELTWLKSILSFLGVTLDQPMKLFS